MTDDSRRRAALEEWQSRLRRPPRDWHLGILQIDPDLFGRLMRFYQSLDKSRIDPKLRHLIWVAVDAVASHLYPIGMELHARAAMNHGATAKEVLEVLEMALTVGERSFTDALPVVLDEVAKAGRMPASLTTPATAAEDAFMAAFEAATGARPAWLSTVFRVSPDFARGLLEVGHGSAAASALDARSRALIMLSIHSCPATLDLDAVRRTTKQCLALGATPEQLVDVLELGSAIGLHSLSLGAPALLRVLEERAAAAKPPEAANAR